MLAFVHIEKCAGQTVHWMLRSAYGLRHCDILPWQGYKAMEPLEGFTAQDLRRLHYIYPRLNSIAGHKVRIYSDLNRLYPDIRYFALIRDPLKRYASHYQFIKINRRLPLDFEEWVHGNDWGANWQTRMLTGVDDVDEAIRFLERDNVVVGLVECFDESLVLVRGLLAPDLDIYYQRRNVASDNSLARQVLECDRTRQILIEQNRSDLALYKYVKHDLYPRYKRAYGARLELDVDTFRSHNGRFNQWNLNLSRVYRNLVYKPLLRLYRLRHGITESVG